MQVLALLLHITKINTLFASKGNISLVTKNFLTHFVGIENFSGPFYNRFPELNFLVKKVICHVSYHMTSHVTRRDSSGFKWHRLHSGFMSMFGSKKLSIFKIT